MPKTSAGILLYRRAGEGLEVLLAHPGGPFWTRRDAGAWTIPKGEVEEGEEPLAAARRELREEVGAEAAGEALALPPRKQRSGKLVMAWAVEGDFDIARLNSITFEMEWPPRSGRQAAFPEVDRVAWFGLDEARERILPGQAGFLDDLGARVLAGR